MPRRARPPPRRWRTPASPPTACAGRRGRRGPRAAGRWRSVHRAAAPGSRAAAATSSPSTHSAPWCSRPVAGPPPAVPPRPAPWSTRRSGRWRPAPHGARASARRGAGRRRPWPRTRAPATWPTSAGRADRCRWRGPGGRGCPRGPVWGSVPPGRSGLVRRSAPVRRPWSASWACPEGSRRTFPGLGRSCGPAVGVTSAPAVGVTSDPLWASCQCDSLATDEPRMPRGSRAPRRGRPAPRASR